MRFGSGNMRYEGRRAFGVLGFTALAAQVCAFPEYYDVTYETSKAGALSSSFSLPILTTLHHTSTLGVSSQMSSSVYLSVNRFMALPPLINIVFARYLWRVACTAHDVSITFIFHPGDNETCRLV